MERSAYKLLVFFVLLSVFTTKNDAGTYIHVVRHVECLRTSSRFSDRMIASERCRQPIIYFVFFTVPALQQTVPTGGVPVCPNSIVEFTCMTEIELQWRDLGTPSAKPVLIETSSQVDQTDTTGMFRTVLTDISGNTLTSTATIDSVTLSDDGRNISCRDYTGLSSRLIATIKLEGQYCKKYMQ